MFLAINEMKKEKLRYGLVIGVILLVAYLIFILSALAAGLSSQNTAAVDSWQAKSVVMSKDANGNLAQSLIKESDLPEKQAKDTDLVGLAQGIIKNDQDRQSATYIGTKAQSNLKQSIKLTAGRTYHDSNEVVLSNKLEAQGFKLNQKIKIGMSDQEFTVVGFAKNAVYNMAPVVYGDLSNWAGIKGVGNQFAGSGLISKEQLKAGNDNLQSYDKQELFNKMPGYSAQNQTFLFMIAFLIVISVVIVAIFLYILTVQKLENLAVLRAQGIPSAYLIKNTLGQTVLMMVLAVVLGAVLAAGTALAIPASAPILFDPKLMVVTGLALIITGIIGAIIPMRIIAKIDPVTVIGG
ncbi:ABC transporter permease [Fructobacillus sp. M2-14]|uniref:Putative hemin transport system permease protein HrtB n=1 Tax=Fructobacillus broussonetiae TaxID=2713173 RepID=A0ABS5R154_9LACO|nr:FtsX-like permease family protein [Fructobacillus broussonetiae]MBS9339173.1 ABC transporter permease [Fructobacillus broussonetiae]